MDKYDDPQWQHYPECVEESDGYTCHCEFIDNIRADERAKAVAASLVDHRYVVRQTAEKIAQTIEAFGSQHPKWDVIGTHAADCWKYHPECALTAAARIAREVGNV